MAYDQEVEITYAMRIFRVRMWETGHSFSELDEMSLKDFGDIVGYWVEKQKAEDKLAEERKRLSRH